MWGEYVADDRVHRFAFGPLTVWVQRLDGEWRIAYAHRDDPLAVEATHDFDDSLSSLLDHEHLARFVDPSQRSRFVVTPVSADRRIVTRPEKPLWIPGQTKTTVYVSTPMWVRIESGGKILTEIPTHTLSDTWFGPNTREGELCYATMTFCRLRLDDLVRRQHRAVTAVHLVNDTDDQVRLDRMTLPVPMLAIYADDETTLWTDALHVELSGGTDLSAVAIKRAKRGTTRVSAARETPTDGLSMRILGSLLGSRVPFGDEERKGS